MYSQFENSKIVTLAFATALMLTIAACGGGGGDSGGVSTVTTAIGQFKDSNTAGLSYVSGGQFGVTDANGSFTYEVGNTVTFSVGGVAIGTTAAKSVVTPVDLVAAGTTGNTTVQNISRFLMLLDEDGDPTNGINIPAAVRAVAANWPQVDFTVADLQPALASIITDVQATGGTHALPTANVAQAHMEATLRCSYAGAFKGTYSGADSGQFGFLVDANDGTVDGVIFSTVDQSFDSINGASPIDYSQNVAFVSGTSGGATFDGLYTSVDEVSGTWTATAGNGNFSGSRIGGRADALFRFTGSFTGTDFGLFSFDVNSADAVTGIAYSVSEDQLLTLSGTVAGTSLTGSASDGTTFSGTLDRTTGALSGTWAFLPSDAGSFVGSGCRLN